MIGLFSLARKSEKQYGVAGLGPKESEKNERHFTEEQLAEGQVKSLSIIYFVLICLLNFLSKFSIEFYTYA